MGKGKSTFSLVGALTTLVKLPITLAWAVVFTPMHWVMWFIVDKLGEDDVIGAKWLKKKFKTLPSWIKWTKEFRTMLNEYYRWPRIANTQPWRCKFCSNKGTHWCVDCNKKMCAQCAYCQHAPGSVAAYVHSVEEIVQKRERHGVHLLSPLLPVIIACWVLYNALFKVTLLDENYLTTQVICPSVNELREIASAADANVFLYFKSSFMNWCDVEDSFFRFLGDFWVRTIVTGTDDTILVLQQLPKALLFDVLLIKVVVPMVSIVYALVLGIVYSAEQIFPRPKLPDDETTRKPLLLKLEDLANSIASFASFGMGTAWSHTKFPPETKWRLRPELDTLEGFYYWKARVSRYYSYYFASCLNCMQTGMWYIVMMTGVARVACVQFGLGSKIRSLFEMAEVGHLIKDAQQKYGTEMNLFVNSSTISYSVSVLFQLAEVFVGTVPQFVKDLSYIWLILFVLTFFINCWIVQMFVKQRRVSLGNWLGNPKAGKKGKWETCLNFGQDLTLQKVDAVTKAVSEAKKEATSLESIMQAANGLDSEAKNKLIAELSKSLNGNGGVAAKTEAPTEASVTAEQ